MEKSTMDRVLKMKRGILPIAAGFMLMPSVLFAQTQKQIEFIRKQSDLKQAQTLKKSFQKNTLTTDQLISRARKLNIPFSGESKGQFFQLRAFDKNGLPLYYVTSNAGAAAGTLTDRLNSESGLFKLYGESMRVHEWDGGGVLASHQEFGGRVTQKDTPTGANYHATHVAGTMIAEGVRAGARGMAPKANLDAYDWNHDKTEMITAAESGALVSNHSYGFTGGFAWGTYSGNQGWHWLGADEDTEYKMYGKYTEVDRDWDLIARTFPYYLPVKAAGNPRGDGPAPGAEHYVRVRNQTTGNFEWKKSTKVRQRNGGDLGYDCINFGALGKNILIIGAAEKVDGSYSKPSDVKMARFSGFGPVDDGRIKPDITGIGVDLYSTDSGGNTLYRTISGTSMASPNVTGSLLLLQEHYKNLNNNFMRSSTLRALAIHTANEAGAHEGPDYASGWGLLNAYKAATFISTKDKYSLIEEKELKNGTQDVIEVVASGTEPLVVTIAWTDPAPKELPNTSVLNDRDTKALINDLDLRVSYDGTEFMPWRLDPANPSAAATKGDNVVDNVEQIVIKNPVPGATYRIAVTHKGELKKNKVNSSATGNTVDLEAAEGQEYSVIVSGINKGVNKDLELTTVRVDVAPEQYSQNTPVTFEILNKGLQAVSGAKLKYQLLNLDNNNEVLASGVEDLEELAPNTKLQKTLSLNLSRPFVNYKLIGNVELEADEIEVNNAADTTTYGYLADLTAEGSSHSFGFETDMVKNGWSSEDTDADGKTWFPYSDANLAKTGQGFAVNFPNKKGTNDWLFSNPMKIKANVAYRLVFDTRKFQAPEEYFSVHFGTAPNSSAMTQVIKDRVLVEPAYKMHVYEFQSSEDQLVYIGFNHKIPAGTQTYAVALDDVKVEYAEGLPSVRFSANQLNPTTFETVSFTNETSTASTQPVTSYEWSFHPSTVTYVEGTTASSKEPKVVFNQEAIYSVTLKATNVKGESTETKPAYITAKNTPAKADFKASTTAILEGETVVFTNTSTGNPAPSEFKWAVTPSEGVEFTSGTSASSTDAAVKFNKYGTYSVSLMVKSQNNEDVIEKKDLIRVEGLYEGVRNLEGNYNATTNKARLTWQRPHMKDVYFENFEETKSRIPADLTVIDANADGQTWAPLVSDASGGKWGLASKSWTSGTRAFTADDFVLTPKLRKGAEVLKYIAHHQYKERYDVYVVEAPTHGGVPTKEEIKAAHKVYSYEGEQSGNTYHNREVNIKQFTSKDFFIAFHHRTLKEDSGFRLVLDDILVGYDNALPSSGKIELEAQSVDSYKQMLEEGKIIVEEPKVETPVLPHANLEHEFGLIEAPYLVGYEVHRNGILVENIEDFNQTSYEESVSQQQSLVYDVISIYSDGKKSDKKTVVIDTTLSTSDVKAQGMKIYPNPSSGKFVLDLGTKVSSLNLKVYDMSGKQLLEQSHTETKVYLDLTRYPKGVYLLTVIDDKGQKHTARLIVK